MFDNPNQLLLVKPEHGSSTYWYRVVAPGYEKSAKAKEKAEKAPGPAFFDQPSGPLDPVLYQLSNSIPERRAHRCPEKRIETNRTYKVKGSAILGNMSNLRPRNMVPLTAPWRNTDLCSSDTSST